MLIDSPPALNIISVNILVATRELVIPIEPHPLLMVLDRLFTTVERIRKLNPSLNVLGFLPTKVHSNSRLAMDMIATPRRGVLGLSSASRHSSVGQERRVRG